MSFTIRALTGADLPVALALLERVELSGAVAHLHRYLRWQPDGAWGAFEAGALEAGALAGMVTLLRFGALGFVGCMAVDPALQGRGLGRLLLEHAHAEGRRAGVATFALEATAAGEPVYRRLGYVAEGTTAVVVRPPPAAGASRAPLPPAGALAADLAAIVELDREATGGPREAALADLTRDLPGALERERRAAGALAAYGLLCGDRLGPVIARDPGAGRAVVDRLAATGACTVAGVPYAAEPALAALAAHGFAEVRQLRRMRLGPPVPARPDWVWALASPGAG